MKPPVFSIIIPAYNAAKTMARALESILAQRFIDYEVLIMDGISTDGTLEIVKDFKDSRIKIFSERDNGVYDAMNKGIERSTGTWLYFLGGDDFLFNNDVLSQVTFHINSKKVDVVYGDVNSTRFGGLYDGKFDEAKIRIKNICHQAIFFKKSVFSKVGLFDISFKAHGDWDHNFKWFFDDSIKKEYISLTIAEYADGGLSSVSGDLKFAAVREWKYLKAQKYRLSLPEKLILTGRLCRNLYAQRRRRDLIRVILKFPDFII